MEVCSSAYVDQFASDEDAIYTRSLGGIDFECAVVDVVIWVQVIRFRIFEQILGAQIHCADDFMFTQYTCV